MFVVALLLLWGKGWLLFGSAFVFIIGECFGIFTPTLMAVSRLIVFSLFLRGRTPADQNIEAMALNFEINILRRQYNILSDDASDDDDLNHCPRSVPFAHAVVNFFVVALIIYAFYPHAWAYFLFIIPLLLGLWNLKSAIFDSQETLDDKLSGKWYRRRRR